MNTKLLLGSVIAITLIVIAGCSKDKYTTKPQIHFKSVSPLRVEKGQPFTFVIEFADKEGDLQDSIWIERVSYNCDLTTLDTFKIPTYPETIKGEFDITYYYSQGGSPILTNGCATGNFNDSCYFRFWMRDNGGHVSDTLKSPDIILLK